MWIIGGTMETNVIDITGLIEEAPVCPICGLPILINENFIIAQAESILFLIHYECSDVEFYHA